MCKNENRARNVPPPGALCPKEKAAFGGSAAVVSLVSAALPNEKTGGGCSAAALGFPKLKPPLAAGAGAAFTSLLAPPNTKPDGAGDWAASFSSGFPKVKVGAAGSFVGNEPKIELACGAGATGDSPNLANTEALVAAVVVVLAVELASDTLSLVVTLSLFSGGAAAAGVALADDVVAVVCGGLSSGLAAPKLKPLLVSVFDDPVPNMIPPLFPNLNPEAAAAGSDFLSSLEAVPNLKPSDEPANLNPEEAALS